MSLLGLEFPLKQEGVKQNHVSFTDFKQNGSAKQFATGTHSDNDLPSQSHGHSRHHHYNHHHHNNNHPRHSASDSEIKYFSDSSLDDSNKSSKTKAKSKKYKRRISYSTNKYRRLEIGKSNHSSRQLFDTWCCV